MRALGEALKGGHIAVVRWLDLRFNAGEHACNFTRDFIRSEFETACQKGRVEAVVWMYESWGLTVDYILLQKGFEGACAGGHVTLVKWFLANEGIITKGAILEKNCQLLRLACARGLRLSLRNRFLPAEGEMHQSGLSPLVGEKANSWA